MRGCLHDLERHGSALCLCQTAESSNVRIDTSGVRPCGRLVRPRSGTMMVLLVSEWSRLGFLLLVVVVLLLLLRKQLLCVHMRTCKVVATAGLVSVKKRVGL